MPDEHELKIAGLAYAAYRNVTKIINALETVGIPVESDENENRLGSLYGIMDRQLEIIGEALNINWRKDDRLTAEYDAILQDGLEGSSGDEMPKNIVERLLRLK